MRVTYYLPLEKIFFTEFNFVIQRGKFANFRMNFNFKDEGTSKVYAQFNFTVEYSRGRGFPLEEAKLIRIKICNLFIHF